MRLSGFFLPWAAARNNQEILNDAASFSHRDAAEMLDVASYQHDVHTCG